MTAAVNKVTSYVCPNKFTLHGQVTLVEREHANMEITNE